MAKVLLVDDEMTMVQMVTEMLRAEGHDVHPYTNGNAALEALAEVAPELVITDLYLDNTRAHGLEILKKARSLNPPASAIMITGFGSIDTAVEAMKLGAYDYLEKPFKLDELRLCIQRALSYNQAISENVYLRKQLKKKYQFNQIIGRSEPMLGVFKMVERVAATDSTVLVRGESGTGKELVARALHFNSNRQFAPFIPINCSALPENLLESELFGHRKGAFTGAINDKLGLFQEADGGTIFLDEIGSMSATLQSRLLRVLQEKEVRRVGDNAPVYVNVRVVAATNEDLEKRIKEGGFREDLYYRLNVISIHLPSLRERPDDIPLLIGHFLRQKVSPRTGNILRMTRKAMSALCAYHWPGNVRELENAIERASALCDGDIIQICDLPPQIEKLADASEPEDVRVEEHLAAVSIPDIGGVMPGKTTGPMSVNPSTPTATPTAATSSSATAAAMSGSFQALKNFLREQEVGYIQRVLAFTGNDKEKAAEIMGVSLATLYRKLAEVEEGA